ncbi:hypothetical protein [Shimazuella kribbensis]|uniref:hypothetical protein n=1 Tax=Shimazuella kribbensis TaxID=139808 RepID=UPI0004269F30|nr:hypothetical protein [Shimazuella kribbensis]
MDQIQIDIDQDDSAISNQAISLFVTVYINNKKQTDILDIDEFFQSIQDPGIYPLFTCDCGFFGCGGYYVHVTHDEQGYRLQNSYKPYDVWNKKNRIHTFQYLLDWHEIYLVGKKLIDLLNQLHKHDQSLDASSGMYGMNLISKISYYKHILGKLNDKLK